MRGDYFSSRMTSWIITAIGQAETRVTKPRTAVSRPKLRLASARRTSLASWVKPAGARPVNLRRMPNRLCGGVDIQTRSAGTNRRGGLGRRNGTTTLPIQLVLGFICFPCEMGNSEKSERPCWVVRVSIGPAPVRRRKKNAQRSGAGNRPRTAAHESISFRT